MRATSTALPMVLAIALACTRTAKADEGMFLLHEAARLPWPDLQRRGLVLDAAGLGGLARAIVQLNRGGTGSFVSPGGLIVTNHHVAYRCLVQLDGTSHPGIMERGHVARSGRTEIPCPGYDLLAVREIRDVTSEVLSAVRPGMKPRQRFEAILVRKRTLEAACEKTGNRVCDVDALNGGVAYTLSVYERLRDVRLVWAPPRALGKFGGDVDNWRYPRHTADFTFLRAYSAPDGSSATFAAANRPFRPARWLTISTAGVRRGDLSLVLGFPGRTMRHATAAQARFHSEHQMAPRARLFRSLLAVLPTTGLSGRRYGGLDAGLNNSAKYYEDSLEQFSRFGLLAKKEREQTAWRAGIGDATEHKALDALLARVGKVYEGLASVRDKILMVQTLQSSILRSLSTAVDIVRWSRLRTVPDVRREGERYRDKNVYLVHQQSDLLDQTTTPEGERALLLALLRHAEALPEAKRPAALRWIKELGARALGRRRGAPGAPDPLAAAVHLVYSKTTLYPTDVEDPKARARALAARQGLFKAPWGRVRTSRDPLVELARRIVEENDRLDRGPLFALDKELGPILGPELVTRFIKPRYWDANFTLRLTLGTVADYTESGTGKTWPYVSRLTWLVKKDRGKEPFLVPPALRAVFGRRDFGRWVDPHVKDVPVNFTATLDTTGGNSGSPVMNGRGELVGLLFDGTPESILSDWQFLEREQRSICVDIRFALFLAEKVDRATYVLRELGLSR